MNSLARRLIAAGFCLMVLHAPLPAAGSGTFTLSASGPTGWTLSYVSSIHPSGSVVLGGRRYVRYESGNDPEVGRGTPGLPTSIVNIGIPRGASLVVELGDVVYETLHDQWVAPQPSFRANDRNEAIAEYTIDGSTYSKDTFLPSTQVSVGTSFAFRSQYLCPVRVSPLQYNPAEHVLRRIVRATIQVKLVVPAPLERTSQSPAQDPLAESTYKDLVINYDQAKQWRESSSVRTARANGDSTRSWFDPAAPWVKMGIIEDGWYRIGREMFLSLGVTPDLSSARLFQKGLEIPSMVEGDSVIAFYAIRNRGDSTYDDFFSDTSYVWLTWGGTPGRRYIQGTGPAAVQNVVSSVNATVHFEKNTDYYVGTGYDEIANTFDIPGEGWVWEYYYPGSALDHSFTLDNIDTSGTTSIGVKARLYSTTSPASTPDHIATFTLNGSSIGQISFNGRKGAWPSFTVPAGILASSNTLRIQSTPTATAVNQFYLDWFEVTYSRKLVAVNDELRFHIQSAEVAPSARFRVAGFSSADVVVADLTQGRAIVPDSVISETSGSYTIVFRDTVTIPRSYIVVSRLPHRTPITLSRKQFTDLRSRPGADYIVLTHPLFRTAANRLAAQRRSTRNIRTQVVDIIDVYDEFNYGIVSPFAIKRFLRYAYEQWAAPAPSNLVILGDASWDPHRYMTTTVMTDFVPAFGVPSGDNWYACFDSVSSFIPSMFIGRLTAMDSVGAESVVSKIIDYDATPPGEWDKRMMFMTAGGDSSENSAFAQTSENVISTYTSPAPLGGDNIRAYKMAPAIIDGSMKPMLMQKFNNGLALVSFLGHSGGRIWGLDAGSPYDLQPANGQLPFIVSVSCNVGGFATPTGMVLSEDYLLADHRGAIGVWASASLGYPSYGTLLLEDFLGQIVEGARVLGATTTSSRILLWEQGGNNYITLAHQFLTPLLGDPMSQFALPVKPDLALESSDLETVPAQPTTADSVVLVKVRVRNFGTVPGTQGSVSISDTYAGHSVIVAQDVPVPKIFTVDSVVVRWRPGENPGQHTFVVSVSLPDSIPEVSKSNNVLSFDRYLYANSLQAIRPLNGQMVAPGSVRLVVAAHAGISTAGLSYLFELDTVATFDSPFHNMSPSVAPKPVSGEWNTPPLPAGATFYWRSRTASGSGDGQWMNANFSTSSQLPASPLVRWEQHRRTQFAGGTLLNTTASDSGVAITAGLPTLLRCRSLGNLGNADKDYYTVLQVGLDVITGLWWNIGNSYMVVRVNNFDGSYVFRPFDLTNPGMADSMAAFIANTPAGMYVGLVAMAYGRFNVNEALYTAIEGLGSQKIRSVQDGQAWALIARKGSPGETVEGYQTDSVSISRSLPTYYGSRTGMALSPVLPVPFRWHSFQWHVSSPPGLTNLRGWMVGLRSGGGIDTLRTFSGDSTTVDLGSVNARLFTYVGFQFGALLNTSESSVTPRVLSWSADYAPPAELAIQDFSPGINIVVPRGTPAQIPLSIYNIGYRKTDSILVHVGLYDQQNRLQPLFIIPGGAIAVDSARILSLTVPTDNLSHQVVLQISVSSADSAGDLFAGNNSIAYNFTVTGAPQGALDVFADGVPLMDGDYVASTPKILLRPRLGQNAQQSSLEAVFVLDNIPAAGPIPLAGGEIAFTPQLDQGRHALKVVLTERATNGITDTLDRVLNITVVNETQILRVYNYPNPFATRTEFTFMLAGNATPEAARIRIYTVAGRKIRDMVLSEGQIVIGYNRIVWDGRDDDGDEIANGVYFYQIEVSIGGKTAAVIGKMARVR